MGDSHPLDISTSMTEKSKTGEPTLRHGVRRAREGKPEASRLRLLPVPSSYVNSYYFFDVYVPPFRTAGVSKHMIQQTS